MSGLLASVVGGYLLDKIFDGGGQVKGKSGKPQLVVAHGGEVILNKTQQKAIKTAKTAKGAKNVLKRVANKPKPKPKPKVVKQVINQVVKKGKKKK